MPALLVAVAGAQNAADVSVLKRVLVTTLGGHKARILDAEPAAAIVGTGLVDQSIVIEFPDAVVARSWLASPDRASALTAVESSMLSNAVIVENAAAQQASSAPDFATGEQQGLRTLIASAAPVPLAPRLYESAVSDRPSSEVVSPTTVSLIALIVLIGALVYVPDLSTLFATETRFLLAVFASCFLLAFTGYIGPGQSKSRLGKLSSAVVILLFAAVTVTLMSTPLPTLLANLAEALRWASAIAMPTN